MVEKPEPEGKRPECFGVRPFYAKAEKCGACRYRVDCYIENTDKRIAELESKVGGMQSWIYCFAFLVVVGVIMSIIGFI